MKTILITGSTDGLGLATAKMLTNAGHRVYLHGRSADKLEAARRQIEVKTAQRVVGSFLADLSDLKQVRSLARQVSAQLKHLDVLINNAGVFTLTEPLTADGLDARFVVNMIAPYLLSLELRPLLDSGSRVVNLSSAAQSPVDLEALLGHRQLPASQAYAESKLGVTMWTNALANDSKRGPQAPLYVSVNPKSFLSTAMVRHAYGTTGNDINIGADILTRAAISDEFAHANGLYYDNDARRFAHAHPDSTNPQKMKALLQAMDKIITQYA